MEIDPIRRGVTRRAALGALGAGAALLGLDAKPALAVDADTEALLMEALVLRDPDIPVAGNPDGDVTLVEYFDYQCPYCRKIEPELRQVVQDDGKVRLIWKDWPILGPVSVVAARMALASKFQDKFVQAHDALIGVNSRLTEPGIREVLSGAGVDIDRLGRDLADNGKTIDAILARNRNQTAELVVQGHAVLHRRQIPRARTSDHARIRAGHCRCAQSGGRAISPQAANPRFPAISRLRTV